MVRGVRIASLVTLWLVPLLIFVSALSSNWVTTWRTLGVPSMTPHFLDLSGFPAAIETLHQGGDPLVANPTDPMHRTMNYPEFGCTCFRQPELLAEAFRGWHSYSAPSTWLAS